MRKLVFCGARLAVAVSLIPLSGSSLAAAPASSKAPAPSLTPEAMGEILRLIAEKGVDRELVALAANSLGLTASGQTWASRSITYKEKDGTLHGFYISRGAEKDLVISTQQPGKVLYAYRARRDGTATAAFMFDLQTRQITIRAPDEAQKSLDVEVAFWRDLGSKQEMPTCEGELGGAHAVTAEAKIKACSDLLASGRLTARSQAMVLVNRSMAYAGQKAEDLEAADLDAATKVDPAYPYSWAQSCSFHTWTRRDLVRAVHECSRAIELDRNDPNGWTFRGDIYLSSNDFGKAIADYDQAIKLDATWMWPWDNRGEAYLRSGHIDRAIQDFEMVIKLSPDYAMGYLSRGTARIKENQFDAALSDFEQGLKIDSKCASCLYGRGIAKGRKGDKAGEAADIEAAKSMRPKASKGFDEDGVAPD